MTDRAAEPKKLSVAARAWRLASRASNLARFLLKAPEIVLRRPANPWGHLKDAEQYADLFARYPVRPLDAAGVELGIFRDFNEDFRKYVKACEELQVAHRVLDLAASTWLEDARASGCRGFICHPSAFTQPLRAMFEERLGILARELKRPTHPRPEELWFYESKRRMAYWLEAHGVPHPETRVFYDRDEAFAFAMRADYPLVCKTDLGSSSSGVVVVRRPAQAYRLVARAFAGGLSGRWRDPRDREWGGVLFQRYVSNAREYRVIQIGDSWFGHEKIADARTGLHSGSGQSAWNVPPPEVFDFCLGIARAGQFEAMDYDVLADAQGHLLINELQAVFSAYNPSQMYRDGVPGRLRHVDGAWRFEEGLFCRNGCANLRVEWLVRKIQAANEPGERT